MKSIIFSLFITLLLSCNNKEPKESISVNSNEYSSDSESDTMSSIETSSAFKNINTIAKDIIQTGIDEIRLISVHKAKVNNNEIIYHKSYRYDNDGNSTQVSLFPGFDIIFGYNLINLSHYNSLTEKKGLFFSKPVLIKSLYYPTQRMDSIAKKPIKRNYFLVTVYDEDNNKDSFLNKRDLRKLYYYTIDNSSRTMLIPLGYSVYKSVFDEKNDAMYVYAKLDENKNGTINEKESAHIFKLDLKNPLIVKRIF